jgi:hypothetical protein
MQLFAQRCALIKKGRACFSQAVESNEAQKGKKAREKAKQRVESRQQARIRRSVFLDIMTPKTTNM